MDRKEIIDLAKGILAQVKADPESLKKAFAGPKPGSVSPAPKKPRKPKLPGFGFFGSSITTGTSGPVGGAPAAAAKQEPKATAKCGTSMMKDDKPHAPNSPEDKAHDVVEGKEPLKQALAESKPPKSRLLSHLRSYGKAKEQGQAGAWTRSPHNQAAGDPRLGKDEAVQGAAPYKSEPKLSKAYLGFRKLKSKLAHKPGVKDPGAVAAAIGRKKYGAKGMAEKSAAARKDEYCKASKEPGAKPMDASQVKGAGPKVVGGKPIAMPAGPVQTKPPHKGRN